MKALLLVLALLFTPALSLAEDVAVLLPNVAKSYTVTTDGKGGAVIVPLAGLVKPGDNPTPPQPPIPPPPTDLTARAKAIQAEAIKVGDSTTAKELAEVYRTVAKLGEAGPNGEPPAVKDAATLQKAATFAADTYLGPIKAPAWQKTRDVLAIQWSQVPAGSPVVAYSKLLREVGDGLDAVDLKKSISPETLKWILEFLLPLLLKLFGL